MELMEKQYDDDQNRSEGELEHSGSQSRMYLNQWWSSDSQKSVVRIKEIKWDNSGRAHSTMSGTK